MTTQAAKQVGTVWSLFTGAMGLDLGLEMRGLKASIAVEVDPYCCQTMSINRPELVVLEEDVRQVTSDKLRASSGHRGEVYLLVGGPPCQSFCPGGKRASLADPRGNLIYEYFRLVKEISPRYFLFENVANLVTAALEHRPIDQRPGKHWNLSQYSRSNAIRDEDAEAMRPCELSGSAFKQLLKDVTSLGYHLRFGIVDACDYGHAQHRLRFVMVGSRDDEPPDFPKPAYGPRPGDRPWLTLRDTIIDLVDDPGPHSIYSPEVAALFQLVPPGGNWRDLPKELQKDALGGAFDAGGGKTGFYRRLHWDCPAPTITATANRKGGALCHPDQTRPLSVRECARLQGFPDDWRWAGSMSRQYRQIGNAVPVLLAKALASMFIDPQPSTHWEPVVKMLENAVTRLRHSARNKRGQPDEQQIFEFA